MERVVGANAFLTLTRKAAYQSAMRSFETIMSGFRSPEDADVYINFPRAGLEDDPSNGLRRDTLALTGEVRLHS